MKQSLQLRLGQQLTMTPQLQQAIRLLQLSTLDLQMEIQQVLESNIMLEAVDEFDEQENLSEDTAQDGDADFGDDPQEISLEQQDNLPDELPVDSSWEDSYDNTGLSGTASAGSPDGDHPDPFARTRIAETLYDHLRWQLDLTPFSDTDRVIALTILDSVGTDGYLHASLEDIRDSVARESGSEAETVIEVDDVAAVLYRLQQFDPAGVAARDLRECLLIQLRQLPKDTPRVDQAFHLIEEFLDLLGNRDYTQLIKKTKLRGVPFRTVPS